ncbi:MAG: SAM-dependent DNA methyltransferase, partial [Micrococcales bacterium]|nr:SAM-dependent DNA methyltransferase [Micrococcales bacterium]
MPRPRQVGTRPPARSGRDQHRQWLASVETDGPFLALPPLLRVWPQGMPPIDPDAKAALTAAKPEFDRAWDRWQVQRKDPAAAGTYRVARDRWVEVVLRDVLGWADLWQPGDPAITSSSVTSPDRSVTVEAAGALRVGDRVGALVWVIDPVDGLGDLTD